MSIRLLAVCLIAAAGFGIFVGGYSAIESLYAERDRAFAEAHLADLDIRFAPDDLLRVPDLSGTEGVAEVEPRLVFPGKISLGGDRNLAGLLVTVDPEKGNRLNQVTLLEGQPFDAAHPERVVIDRNLAKYHDLAVGATFSLELGGEVYALTVGGVGSSAEFLVAPANPSVFVPSKGSLGVVYGVPRLVHDRIGFPLANSLLVRFQSGVDAPTVQDTVVVQLRTALTVDSATLLAEQFSNRFLELSLSAFKVFLPALVVVFDLAAFLVTLFLLFQWVVQERREVGMLMALGYPRGGIALAYLLPILVLAAGAVLFGLGVAWMTAVLFADNYASSIGFPRPEIFLSPWHFLIGVVGLLVVMIASAGWPTVWLLRLSPLEAVRDAGQERADRMGILGRLVAWLPGKTWFRYGARNIVRHKALSFTTAFSVALGFGLTISFFMNLTSNMATAVQMAERDPWDGLMDLFGSVETSEAEQIEAFEGVAKAVPYVKFSGEIRKGAETVSAALGGFPPESEIRNPEIVDGRGIETGDEATLILERNRAAQCGIRVGDKVELAYGSRIAEATVVGLLSGALPGEAYMPLSLAQTLVDQGDRCTGFFLMFDGDKTTAKQALLARPNVATVLLKEEITALIEETMGEKVVLIRIGAAFSVAITLLFIFCSISFTVLQRKTEYVMLRILGFGPGTVGVVIIVEVLALGLAAVLMAVPVAYLCADFLNDRVSEAWYNVVLVVEFKDFARTLIPGFLLMPLAALGAIRHILRQPLDQTLRERRFG